MIINMIKTLRDRIPYRRGMITDDIKSRVNVDIEGKRICFALGGGLGDCLMLTPLLKWIKEHCEKVFIICAFPKAYLDVFIGHPYINHLMVYDKHNDPDVKLSYDYCFDFGHAITMHEEAEQVCGTLAYFNWIGVDTTEVHTEDLRPIVTLNPMAMDSVAKFVQDNNLYGKVNIALQMRASSLIRTWLPEYIRQLARMLGNDGYNVILFDNEPVLSITGFTGKNILWGSPDLKSMSQVVCCLNFCDVIVAPDSSFVQLALALKKPFVGIYGPFPISSRTLVSDLNNFSIELESPLECQPCFMHRQLCPHQSPSPCMDAVTPEQVYEQVKKAAELSKSKSCSAMALKTDYGSQVMCPYCGSSHSVDFVEYSVDVMKCSRSLINTFKDTTYRICLACRSIYQEGEISNKGMLSMYNEHAYHDSHAEDPVYLNDQKVIAGQVSVVIKDYLQNKMELNGIEIVNFGCGIAAFDRMLIKTDPERIRVASLDVSTHAAHIAKKKFDIDITLFDICQDRIPREYYYNLAILSHTLEHLNGYEIVKAVEKAHRALHKEKGLLYIRGPIADRYFEFQPHAKDDVWIHMKPHGGKEQHISISSIKGITELLIACNFKVIFARKTEVFTDDFEILAKPTEKVIASQISETTMTRSLAAWMIATAT